MASCPLEFPCLNRGAQAPFPETERRVKANDADYNSTFQYANNYIRTSKYTLLTFIPCNLYEQFQRIANIYFFILLILQLIPWISSLTFVTTVVPLVLVLALTAIKDAYDDVQRHRSDSSVNSRKSYVLDKNKKEFVVKEWHMVAVGDVIRLEDNGQVAADLLLLATGGPNGLCYIETAELDGETNLKVRQALDETADMKINDLERLSQLDFSLICEAPNNNLAKFEGSLTTSDTTVPLSNDQMLLRGCVLRNTSWCYGLVVFAGKDTKLMKNSGQTAFKRTSTDRQLNFLIIGIVVFLMALCLVCVVASGIWETLIGYSYQAFLPWESFVPGTATGDTPGTREAGATVISILVFFSYLILFNTVVPISLYVSVEFLRLVQSFWINWDAKMYYEPKDTPAKCRTTALNEELGQIEYIFSDKTGTLTQNIMTFNKCSIQGVSYGDPRDASGNPCPNIAAHDFKENKDYDKLAWYDLKLISDIRQKKDDQCHQFFRLLALCHTVMPDYDKNNKLCYQAQSPDEAALVGAARDFGFVFKTRTPTTITIEVMGIQETYELLCILDFNNVRKRMSVIVRKNDDDKILLLCKGADTTVNARLSAASKQLLEVTSAHLNEYANLGLRTLSLAYKVLDHQVYNRWKAEHYEASISLTDREDKLHDIYEKIEVDMDLIGATAIEDKLQDGVPQAIANLANAGIKIWVLTGDKQETAINIGYSCKLLTDEMEEVFVVDGESYDDVKRQLTEARDKMLDIKKQHQTTNDASGGNIENLEARLVSYTEHGEEGFAANKMEDEEFGGFGIVINGHSLVEGLGEKLEMLLLEVGCLCKAVICCRVTPLQKAQVVELVKEHKNSITLAIGDGANDVSMIKTAHIGVGISGQEGMQAVLSSDYSFAQFRYLERLLLVHGRWSYYRMCKFLVYFFYKNFAFTLTHLWYAFFVGFSAQSVYDEAFIAIYNVVYTSMPILMLGVFDQDVDEELSIKYPKLYTPGLCSMWFNKKLFAFSLVEGLATSCIIYFVCYFTLYDAVQPDGIDLASRVCLAFMVSSTLILVVTLRCALEMSYWTPFNFFFIVGSVVAFYAIHAFIYADFFGSTFQGTLRMLCATVEYWLGMLLATVILIVPIVAIKLWNHEFHLTLADRLKIKTKIAKSGSYNRKLVSRPKTSIRREQRALSVRSGFAFAHESGFGDIITTGRYIPKTDDIDENSTNIKT